MNEGIQTKREKKPETRLTAVTKVMRLLAPMAVADRRAVISAVDELYKDEQAVKL